MTGVFVSHAHSDEPLVRALARLLEHLFGNKIGPVNYSSRKETGGGIEPGDEWFGWIVNQVQNARQLLDERGWLAEAERRASPRA